MMMNEIGIYILTYNRAKKCDSMEMVLDNGFYENLFLVVQDNDPQLEEYENKYKDYILKFSKKVWKQKTDTMDSFGIEAAAVYARNFILDDAKKRKFKYIVMLDDDIKGIRLRYKQKDKMKSYKCSFRDAFEMQMKFLQQTSAAAISGRYASGYVGGGTPDYYPIPTQCLFIKMENVPYFRGSMLEDSIFPFDLWDSGRPCFGMWQITLETPTCRTNAGGIHDEYVNANLYVEKFYCVLRHPFIKIKVNKKGTNVYIPHNFCYPKILSDRYKK